MKLWRRRRTNTNTRQAGSPGTANVFSYYANRTTGDVVPSRHHSKPKFKSRRLWHILPTVLAAVAILVSLGYLLWLDTSPRVVIVSSTPASETVTQSKETYQKAGQKLLSQSIFNRIKPTVDTNKIADKFKAQFPEITEVAITTPIAGHKLIFEIQPTTPSLALNPAGSNELIVLDERGRALFKTRDTANINKLSIPIITDESGINIEVGDNVLPAENILFITQVVAQLRAKNIAIQSITLPQIANELHIRPADQAYYVKFNIVGEARLQAGSFIATKQWLEREGRAPTQYIDVRTEEKVYYQ